MSESVRHDALLKQVDPALCRLLLDYSELITKGLHGTEQEYEASLKKVNDRLQKFADEVFK